MAEFSLVAADRSAFERAATEGDRRAGRVVRLLDRLSFHLSGTQMGITVTSVVLGFLAEPAVAAVLDPVLVDPPRAVSVVVALVVATVFQMVFGELVPKQVAIAYADRSVRLLARPIQLFGLVAGPAIERCEALANRVVRRLGVEPRGHLAAGHTREELEWLLKASGEEGGLEPDEVSLLTRSIRFAEKTAADALTPRTQIVAVADDDPVAVFVALAVESGYSRLPVFRGDLDDIVGVVHVKSVFGLSLEERAVTPVREIMSGVLAVPETRDLDELFADFRDSRAYLAVVVDEHGGTAGIITLEDLLEELVGEIDDEYDEPATPRPSRHDGPWVLSGGLHRDEIADTCGFLLPEGEYETLAGFVLDELGHIPTAGERVERDGWRFEIMAMQKLRIATIRAHAPEGADANTPALDAGGRDLAP